MRSVFFYQNRKLTAYILLRICEIFPILILNERHIARKRDSWATQTTTTSHFQFSFCLAVKFASPESSASPRVDLDSNYNCAFQTKGFRLVRMLRIPNMENSMPSEYSNKLRGCSQPNTRCESCHCLIRNMAYFDNEVISHSPPRCHGVYL